MKIKNYLVLDCETFFDKENDYDLRSLSLTEFIRDQRFKLHGFGFDFSNPGLPNAAQWCGNPKDSGLEEMNWEETAIIGHNCKFDASVLAWHFGIVPALYIDTKGLARAVLGPHLSGYSLNEVGQYLGLKAKGTILEEFSGKRDLTPEDEKRLAEYCLDDVEICKGIFETLWPKFPESQRQALDWTIRTFVEPKLSLDVNVLTRMVDNEKIRREDAISRSGIDKRVLSSNQQFAAHLTTLGVPVPTKVSKRTGKEIPALGLSDPGFLALEDSNPILFQARKAAKSTIIETRGSNLIHVGKTGKWPFDVQFSGAVQTHRYSGGDGAGGNPQNFPKNSDIKRAIMAAEEDSLLIVGDFSAVELRINAWLSKEIWLQEMLIEGKDIYCAFGSKVYGREITKADKIERQFGKVCELGLGYGMGKEKFQGTVRTQVGTLIPLEQAKEVVGLYRATHPKIKNLWQLAENLVPMMIEGKPQKVFFAPFLKIEKNAIKLPSGLKIMYPNLRLSTIAGSWGGYKQEWIYDRFYKRHEASSEKLYGGKIVENICQALAGELCKEAIDECLNIGLNVVGQVHDEIIVTCSKKDSQNCANLLKSIMETSPTWWSDLNLKAEVKIGSSWMEAK